MQIPASSSKAGDDLVGRAGDVNAKVLVGAAAQQVIRNRVPVSDPSNPAQAATADATAPATSKYPGLRFKQAEFDHASRRLEAVDACKVGRTPATDAVVQLQQAAATTRGAWFLACKDEVSDLLNACQLG